MTFCVFFLSVERKLFSVKGVRMWFEPLVCICGYLASDSVRQKESDKRVSSFSLFSCNALGEVQKTEDNINKENICFTAL